MNTRGFSRLAVLLCGLCLLAAVCRGQGNAGVIFSEVVYGPSVSPSMPSYIELVMTARS